MAENNQPPKIHIDSDWKAQAQAEKEKLTQQSRAVEPKAGGAAAAAPRSAGGARGEIPPASIETLVSSLAAQALFAMGAIPDPRTGQRMQALDVARHHIDMLGLIEEKTKGNLTEAEANLLAGTVYELRSRYIQAVNAARGV